MTVRRARPDEIEAALALRERVFCGEQGVSPAAERDGLDASAVHLVALDDRRVVGTCRLLIDSDAARLGRMAVEQGWRHRGIGRALVVEAERIAREVGVCTIKLNAQLAARPLYARNGYTQAGKAFLEEGMKHVAMRKTLCPNSA